MSNLPKQIRCPHCGADHDGYSSQTKGEVFHCWNCKHRYFWDTIDKRFVVFTWSYMPDPLHWTNDL